MVERVRVVDSSLLACKVFRVVLDSKSHFDPSE